MTYWDLLKRIERMDSKNLHKKVIVSFPIQQIDAPFEPIDYLEIEVQNISSIDSYPVILLKTEFPAAMENLNS